MSQPNPTTANNQAFPSMNTPLVTDNGAPNVPWYQFFLNLYNRTGGAAGVDGTTVAQATEDNALLIAITMGLTGT